jgi:hypothetical protein
MGEDFPVFPVFPGLRHHLAPGNVEVLMPSPLSIERSGSALIGRPVIMGDRVKQQRAIRFKDAPSGCFIAADTKTLMVAQHSDLMD